MVPLAELVSLSRWGICKWTDKSKLQNIHIYFLFVTWIGQTESVERINIGVPVNSWLIFHLCWCQNVAKRRADCTLIDNDKDTYLFN